jgi:hypothetical protein
MEASPNRSARLAGPRTTTVITALVFSLLRSKQLVSLFFATFSKRHAFPLGATNCRRCIPLSYS